MKNYNTKNKFKKAFTLIEVLIASTIFAAILVMTTGVVSLSSGYQRKLVNIRKTANDINKISEMITSDIRNANATAVVDPNTSNEKKFYHGLILLNCKDTDTSCHYANSVSGIKANTLVTFFNDGYSVYFFENTVPDSGQLYYKKFPISESLTLSGLYAKIRKDINVISNNNFVARGTFGGYAPNNKPEQQPFIQFKISSSTPDYTTSTDAAKYVSVAGSSVTSRRYPEGATGVADIGQVIILIDQKDPGTGIGGELGGGTEPGGPGPGPGPGNGGPGSGSGDIGGGGSGGQKDDGSLNPNPGIPFDDQAIALLHVDSTEKNTGYAKISISIVDKNDTTVNLTDYKMQSYNMTMHSWYVDKPYWSYAYHNGQGNLVNTCYYYLSSMPGSKKSTDQIKTGFPCTGGGYSFDEKDPANNIVVTLGNSNTMTKVPIEFDKYTGVFAWPNPKLGNVDFDVAVNFETPDIESFYPGKISIITFKYQTVSNHGYVNVEGWFRDSTNADKPLECIMRSRESYFSLEEEYSKDYEKYCPYPPGIRFNPTPNYFVTLKEPFSNSTARSYSYTMDAVIDYTDDKVYDQNYDTWYRFTPFKDYSADLTQVKDGHFK